MMKLFYLNYRKNNFKLRIIFSAKTSRCHTISFYYYVAMTRDSESVLRKNWSSDIFRIATSQQMKSEAKKYCFFSKTYNLSLWRMTSAEASYIFGIITAFRGWLLPKSPSEKNWHFIWFSWNWIISAEIWSLAKIQFADRSLISKRLSYGTNCKHMGVNGWCSCGVGLLQLSNKRAILDCRSRS